MRKFVSKLIKGFLIYIVLTFVITNVLYSYIQNEHINYLKIESSLITEQYDNLIESHDVNTLFLGTSKTFRQINPSQFDTAYINSNSLNLGVNNLYPFRSLDFESFISPKCDSIKRIVYEVRDLGLLGKNYNSINNIVSISGNRYLQLIKMNLQKSSSIKSKVRELVNLGKLFIYKSLGIGMSRFWISNSDKKYLKYGKVPSNGFLSLEKQLKIEQENNYYDGAQMDREKYLKWKEKNDIYNFFLRKENVPEQKEVKSVLGELNLKHLRTFFPNAEIIFVIPPRTLPEFYNDVCLQMNYYKDHGYQCFDFSNPVEYPKLYSDSSTFDIGHLNDHGSVLYTSYLVKALKGNNH